MDRTELSEAIIQEVSDILAEELRAAGSELLTVDLDGAVLLSFTTLPEHAIATPSHTSPGAFPCSLRQACAFRSQGEQIRGCMVFAALPLVPVDRRARAGHRRRRDNTSHTLAILAPAVRRATTMGPAGGAGRSACTK